MRNVLSLALLFAIIAALALASGTGAQGDPAAVVAAFERAFNEGNVQAALDTFSAEPVIRTPADVYPSRGLVESWLEARILVDKVKYNLEGQRTVSGNKVNWEIKPSTGANLLAEASVEGGKITRLELRNKPEPTAAPAAGAAGAAQNTPAAGAAQTTPAAGAAAGAAQTTPAAGAAQTTPASAANVAQATPAATPSALPATGVNSGLSVMWIALAGLLLTGLGVILLRRSIA